MACLHEDLDVGHGDSIAMQQINSTSLWRVSCSGCYRPMLDCGDLRIARTVYGCSHSWGMTTFQV